MGWGGGTEVCENVWGRVREYIPKSKRAEVLADIIKILNDMDWDGVNELEFYEDEWDELTEALKISGWAREGDDNHEE